MGIARLVAAVAAAYVLFAADAAAAQASAEGVVRYDDRAVPITHAYARQVERAPELVAAGASSRSLKVLLADRPAPPGVAASQAAFMAAATAGQIQGMVIQIDQPSNQWMILTISRPGSDGSMISGGMDPARFELSDFRIQDGIASGRVRTLAPQDYFVREADGGPTAYAFDVRFRAPVAPPRRPVATLSGAEARASPQADAVIALYELIRSGDLRRIRAELDPRFPLASRLADDEAALSLLEGARNYFPAADAARASIQRIVVHDDHALVFMSSGGSGGTMVTVEPDGGRWRAGLQRMPGD